MAALAENIGLIFRMKSEGADKVSSDLTHVQKDITKVGDSSKELSTTSAGFDKLASAIGVSSEAMASAVPVIGAIAAAFTVVAGAAVSVGKELFNLAQHASDVGSQIQDFQEKTGLAADTIQTLKYNLEQSGQSLDNMGTPIKKFTALMYDAANGNKEATETLAKFGVTDFKDLDGGLTKVLEKIKSGNDDVEQFGLAAEIAGNKGADGLKVLANAVNGDLAKAIETAKKFGIVLSEEDVKAADEFGDALALMGKQAEITAAKFALQYAPQITSAMAKIGDFVVANQSAITEWGKVVSNVISGAAIVFQGLQQVVIGVLDVMTLGLWRFIPNVQTWAGIILSTLSPVIGAFNTIGQMFGSGSAHQAEASNQKVVHLATRASTPKISGGGGGRSGGGGGGGGGGAKGKTQEQLNAEAVKEREALDARILQIAKNTAEEDKAINDKELESKLLSESVHRKNIEAIEQELLVFERTLLEKRLEMTQLTAKDRLKIETEIAKLTSELNVKFTEEETGKLQDKNEELKKANETLERQKKIVEDISAIQRKITDADRAAADFKAEQKGKVLENTVDSAKNTKERNAALQALRDFELEQANIKQERRLADIANDRATAEESLTAEEIRLGKKQELDRLAQSQDLAAYEEFNAKKKEIEDKYKADTNNFGDGFGGNLLESVFGSPEQLNQVANGWNFLGQSVGNIVKSMIGGVGQLVQSWVLLGNSGGQSLRKFAAQAIASVAQMAAVDALYELAKGFAMLFIDPPAAASHFTAAAIFGGIAGVAAISGRLIAGDSFKNQSATNATSSSLASNNTSTSANNSPNQVTESRIQRQETTIKVMFQDGLVAEHVKNSIANGGSLKDVFVKLIEETA